MQFSLSEYMSFRNSLYKYLHRFINKFIIENACVEKFYIKIDLLLANHTYYIRRLIQSIILQTTLAFHEIPDVVYVEISSNADMKNFFFFEEAWRKLHKQNNFDTRTEISSVKYEQFKRIVSLLGYLHKIQTLTFKLNFQTSLGCWMPSFILQNK